MTFIGAAVIILSLRAPVAELADAPDLGSGVIDVKVQVLSGAPRRRERRNVRADVLYCIKTSALKRSVAPPFSRKTVAAYRLTACKRAVLTPITCFGFFAIVWRSRRRFLLYNIKTNRTNMRFVFILAHLTGFIFTVFLGVLKHYNTPQTA